MKMHLQRSLLFIALIFSILSFLKSLRDVERFGDIDLRDKIVGARLLNEGFSPYYYKWQSGDDERLLDPLDRFDQKVSRVTAPPSLLGLFVPLGKLKHGDIQWVWFSLSWVLILIILFQFYGLFSLDGKGYVLAAGLIFFTCSMAWQMHLERGQVYIVFSALLGSSYWFYKKEKYLAAGAVFALLCWLRLPFLFCIPLLFLFAQRKQLLTGYAASFVFLLLVSFVFIPVEVWKDYFSSLQEWSRFQLYGMTTVPGSVNPVIPSVIEGETNPGLMRDFLQNNRSVQGNVKGMFDAALDTGQLAMMFLFVVSVLSFLLFRRVKRGGFILKAEQVFVFIFLLYILTEYFSPAPSYSYHYIQWIVPVLICLSAPTFRVGFAEVLVAAGLAMNLGAVSFIPYSLLMGEGMLFAGIYLFSSDRNRWL